ncbi:3',5'-cyclic adenosine monophosphate phosphodiesterase CpdA [Planomonospora parontospora subsp. parontospora]|uniref:3',5'-cyclic adenosine monophosphate phosphodiesterase CpdA n=2 Tax=Planomonospora parontospora TaxID=58119 RepID=A0AA37BF01_9ACTN|nr:metallophosphoesterase [Planomonospora parontospora]GGK60264.1 3',5'-cyclic adenosine monophosphate phosphodiesterase CpdA [Planomonospora parontospora]GII08792.1 3',5'-cyclic adenosine monophosphate phosphodiesterase CpdA [Planomonospora parontospora subsp. parontospora]
MLTLAHLSDTHIDDDPRSADRTRAVMRHLESLPGPLDAVLVTGDIADHGAVEEYETARGLLASRFPTAVCPGNHDDRTAFRKVLLSEESGGAGNGADGGNGGGARPVNRVLRLDGLTVALCDSSVPGRPEGFLEDETIAWLDAVLTGSPGTPALIGMHHPAAALGIPYVDGIGLRSPERLEEVLRRHPQVVAVLAGHAHTPASTVFAGLPLLVAPGVVSTALTPAETAERIPVDRGLPPQFALHVFDGRRLTTHVRTVI